MSTHTYSLVLTWSDCGNFAQNVLHLQFEDGGFTNTAAAAGALNTAWNAANKAKLLALVPSTSRLLSIKSRALNVPGGFESVLIQPAAQIGTRAGNVQVSGCGPVAILYPINNGYQRGRVFLPGISNLDAIDGVIQPGYKTAFTTNATIFKDPITLLGGGNPVATPVLYHFKPLPTLSRVIEYVRLSDLVGQLRQRHRPA